MDTMRARPRERLVLGGQVLGGAGLGLVAVALAAMLGAACATGAPTRTETSSASTSGGSELPPSEPGVTIALAGPILGKRELQPSRCIAGGHYLFFGADLVDERTNFVARAVIDPIEGTVVRIFDAEDADRTTVVLHRRDCKRFTVDVQPTGSWVNGIDQVSLAVDLDCRARSGDAVVGSYRAAKCV